MSTSSKSQNLLIGFLLLTIFPLVILFLFNHPSADDWWYSEAARAKGLLGMQKHIYMEWSGRYFLTAVSSVSPLYFHSIAGYKIETLLVMLMFFYSLFLLISVFTKYELIFRERLLLTSAVFFMYIYAMPTLIEAFYWLNSVMTYQFPLVMLMFFLVLNTKIDKSKNTFVKLLLTFLCIFALIAAIGSNEMAIVLSVLMISLLLIYKIINREKISVRHIVFAIVIALASIFSYASPGNAIRRSLFASSPLNQNLSFTEAVMKTLFTLGDYLSDWILGTPLIFVTLLTAPLLFKIAKNLRNYPEKKLFEPLYAAITILIMFSTLFILFFVPLWLQGTEISFRTVNLFYFIFLISWFYCSIMVMYYLSKKINFDTIKIPKFIYAFAFLMLVLFLFKPNNIKTAGTDLLSGSAAKYDNELNQRYELIRKSDSDTVFVPDIIHMPRTLFLIDITSNPKDDLNKYYAHYFNKKAIAIKDPLN